MVFDTSQQKDGAVSPVIGVVLMVAITVILAAIIGTFVLGLGQETNAGADAGVTFNEDTGTLTVISAPRADHINVTVDGTLQDGNSDGYTFTGDNLAGSTLTGLSPSNSIVVTATYQGETQVVQEFNDFNTGGGGATFSASFDGTGSTTPTTGTTETYTLSTSDGTPDSYAWIVDGQNLTAGDTEPSSVNSATPSGNTIDIDWSGTSGPYTVEGKSFTSDGTTASDSVDVNPTAP
jgi:flagellin-like protein